MGVDGNAPTAEELFHGWFVSISRIFLLYRVARSLRLFFRPVSEPVFAGYASMPRTSKSLTPALVVKLS